MQISPCVGVFCNSLIISNNVPRTCVLAFQRLLPKKWCKMLLLVWFSVADYSLLLSAEKPQVPATVRGIKRKLPGTLFVNPWQSISSGGGGGSARYFSNELKIRCKIRFSSVKISNLACHSREHPTAYKR